LPATQCTGDQFCSDPGASGSSPDLRLFNETQEIRRGRRGAEIAEKNLFSWRVFSQELWKFSQEIEFKKPISRLFFAGIFIAIPNTRDFMFPNSYRNKEDLNGLHDYRRLH
jgi:hypothetical protein